MGICLDLFNQLNTAEVYSLKQGEYLGIGTLHLCKNIDILAPAPTKGKPKHNYPDLWTKKNTSNSTRSVDYHKFSRQRPWSFHNFTKTIADLLDKKGSLSDFTIHELKNLKKTYNQSTQITKPLIKKNFCPDT